MPLYVGEPYLELQGPRPLSPLEQDAVRLVFCGSLNPCDLYVTVIDDFSAEPAAGSHGGHGNIKINRRAFEYADALNLNSTRANTAIFKPKNMAYLSTLIHESTHQWQWNYEKYLDAPGDVRLPYDFAREELHTMKFLKRHHKRLDKPGEFPEKAEFMKEQHASIAQVYFVIAWQLEYSSDRLVNLTTGSAKTSVGKVKRYHEIAAIQNAHPYDPIPPDDSCDAAPPGRRVSRGCARRLSDHFGRYLVDLRSGGRRTVKLALSV